MSSTLSTGLRKCTQKLKHLEGSQESETNRIQERELQEAKDVIKLLKKKNFTQEMEVNELKGKNELLEKAYFTQEMQVHELKDKNELLEDICINQKEKRRGLFGRRMEEREVELEKMKQKILNPQRERGFIKIFLTRTPLGKDSRTSPEGASTSLPRNHFNAAGPSNVFDNDLEETSTSLPRNVFDDDDDNDDVRSYFNDDDNHDDGDSCKSNEERISSILSLPSNDVIDDLEESSASLCLSSKDVLDDLEESSASLCLSSKDVLDDLEESSASLCLSSKDVLDDLKESFASLCLSSKDVLDDLVESSSSLRGPDEAAGGADEDDVEEDLDSCIFFYNNDTWHIKKGEKVSVWHLPERVRVSLP